MITAIIKIPASVDISSLPKDLVKLLFEVNASWEIIGNEVAEYKLADVVLSKEFKTSLLPTDWTILGMWSWDGQSSLVELMPINSTEYLKYIPNEINYGSDGTTVLSSVPPTVAYEISAFAGWPQRFGPPQ